MRSIKGLAAPGQLNLPALYQEIDVSRSGSVNLDKMHAYLLRMPGIFSSRDAEAIVDRISIDKSSINGFDLGRMENLFGLKKETRVKEFVEMKEVQEHSSPLRERGILASG